MICKECGCEHDGLFGSKYGEGRFCSRECANTRHHNQATKAKISRSLKGRKLSEEHKKKTSEGLKRYYKAHPQVISESVRRKIGKSINKNKKIPDSILELSKRTTVKIIRRMRKPCSQCGWYVEGAIGDLHHIKPKKEGGTDEHENLSYICPNCHRLVESGIIKPDELITLDVYLGDEWKEYLYI